LKLLLEIGVEEIPDWMIPPAVDHLRAQFENVVLCEGTPRRLAVIAQGYREREADRIEIVKGPPITAPAAAVEGFARKQGVAPQDLVEQSGYYQIAKKIEGRATADVLAEKLPALVLGIPWPKTMLWPSKGGARFIRPIRWIVCLLGKNVVPFEINGVKSSNTTMGHRLMGRPKPVKVTIASYEKALAKNGVILRAAHRRAKLVAEVGQDTPLIDLHVYLNEYPTALRGSYDPAYLTLPREVRETVMRAHQKYFALPNDEPGFIAVMNRADDPGGLIRRGHERVLRARFNDARFFYDVDRKKPLRERLEDLKAVTFHRDIGSYYDKTMRIVALCGDETSKRATLLAKCDLTTEMVKEFTELQGIIGGRYAEAQGESAEVAAAIYDQYVYDRPPSTRAGQVLALADRMDTLREMFRIGQIPSGSKDPFALRRAASGVVRILAEGDTPGLPFEPSPELREFLLDRVRTYFRDARGFAYDEVNAVLAAGWDDLKDAGRRLEAVRAVRATENFEPLAASFKRIKNILAKAEFAESGAVDESLLEPGAEAGLYAASRNVKLTGDYGADLTAIASLRPAVDAFFDSVMVNVEDQAVRRNRLTLLSSLLVEFSRIADFSEIVTRDSGRGALPE
jgi:glycyl-tRNA synthetase beta chain